MPARSSRSSSAQLDYIIAARDAQFQRVTDRVLKRLERVERQGNRTTRSTKGVSNSLNRLSQVSAVVTAAIGSLGIHRLGRRLGEARERVDRLAKTVRNLNLPIQEFQAWRQAAKEAGIENAEFTKSIQQLNRFIGDTITRESKEYLDVWERLGVEIRDTNGALKPTAALFYEVQDALRGIQDSSVQQSLIQQLFGRGGRELRAFLVGGSTDLKEFTQSYVDGAKGIDAATASMAESLQNLRDAAGQELTDQLDRVLVRMDAFFGISRGVSAGGAAIAGAFRSIGDSLGLQDPSTVAGRITSQLAGFDAARRGRFAPPRGFGSRGRGGPSGGGAGGGRVRQFGSEIETSYLSNLIERISEVRQRAADAELRIVMSAHERAQEARATAANAAQDLRQRYFLIRLRAIRAHARDRARIEGEIEEERIQAAIAAHQRIARAQEAAVRMQEERMRDLQRAAQPLSDALFNLVRGSESAGSALRSFLNTVLDNITRKLTDSLAQSLFSGLGGGGGGGFFGFLGGLFGSQRGGPAGRGRAIRVGESGPEIFIPDVAGAILPNTMMPRAPAAPVVNLIFNIESTDGPGVRAAIQEAEPRLTGAAIRAVATQQARPGTILGRQNRTGNRGR